MTLSNGYSMRTSKSSGHVLYIGLALLLVIIIAFAWLTTQRLTKPQDNPSKPSTIAINGTKDISYGPSTLDIYKPANDATNYPVVILVHGGSWTGGDKKQLATEAQDLADANYVVLNINYPLATDNTIGFPREQQAVMTAIDWAIQHKTELNIDTSRLALVGGSAGGTLVLQAGMLANTDTAGKVKVITSFSGTTDLPNERDDLLALYPNIADSDDFETTGPHQVELYLGCKLATCPEATLKAASPRYNIDSTSCPVIGLLHSAGEAQPATYVTQFYNDLKTAGCTAKLQIVPGSAHSFAYWPQVKTDVIKWMTDQLNTLSP